MEGKVQDDTSNGNFKHQCPEKFMNTYMKECKKSWMVAEEHKDDFENVRNKFNTFTSLNTSLLQLEKNVRI